jgi:hypothetical protein
MNEILIVYTASNSEVLEDAMDSGVVAKSLEEAKVEATDQGYFDDSQETFIYKITIEK